MARRFKFFIAVVLVFFFVVLAIPAGIFAYRIIKSFRIEPGPNHLTEQLQREVAKFESRQPEVRRIESVASEYQFKPIRSLYSLNRRGCEDHEISSLILQNELAKKDPRLAYEQLDIDKCNAFIYAYVKRGVRENENYYLRRRLVESFGQTNRAVLINRMRLVAVLLGGEKGRDGMDPRFTPIREEAHRFSPRVLAMIERYIEKMNVTMKQARVPTEAPEKFRSFVDSLGNSYESEYRIARIGADYRGEVAEELYALNVLLRDLKEYYGERIHDSKDTAQFSVLFSNPGTFQSDTLEKLKRSRSSHSRNDQMNAFIALGHELREHLSTLRESRGNRTRVDDEEVNQLKKINEIVATLSGLVASERLKMPPLLQASTLVDVLYLEGLYSKKQRKRLMKELDAGEQLDPSSRETAKAFNDFLSYLHGLAYSTLDESLGDAARAYARISKEAANYMEIQARKSSLQILGQLQLDYYQKHRELLSIDKEIHLAGSAQGRLMVFRTQSEIASYLREDPLNGAGTIWVLKAGLNMPNEASFAAIILEDPIMKASHYDGYARSRDPVIPLMQIPDASDQYAHLNRKNVILKASTGANAEVVIEEAAPAPASNASNTRRTDSIRLERSVERTELFAIDSTMSDAQIREMQKHAGAKAANYAFLRSNLPRGNADTDTKAEEHNYPGFAIPFAHYERHVGYCGAREIIANLERTTNPEQVRELLKEIRRRITTAPMDKDLFGHIARQMDNSLKSHPTNLEGSVKLRFRSSSNAEDNREFSGAGLYESHPAFYHFDASERNFEEISQAVRQVWASVWKAEAFLAREAADIAQNSVQMGILVHPSYRKEEATGVVYYYDPEDIEIVANKDNENVQNPSIAGLTPEMHHFIRDEHRQQHSSRYAFSKDEVLDAEVQEQLLNLMHGVVPRFKQLYPNVQISAVDVEFKLMEIPRGADENKDVIMLKQIRPIAPRK